MKRKEFLRSMALIAGGFSALRWISPSTLKLSGALTIEGTVRSAGKPLASVLVSDGYNVVKTNRKGKYKLTPDPDARLIFISTPAGYHFVHENNVARHYKLLAHDVKSTKAIEFDLEPLGKDDHEHQFVIWADPQVMNETDLEKMFSHSVPDVKKLVAAAGRGALLHGITIGDIVWDRLDYFAEYDKAVAQIGIPFFQCLGNHDLDLNSEDDAHSDISFVKNYGPTYYSFNRGKAHYVVLDNVRYLGKDKGYDGYIQQHQLDWLAKDLSFVPSDHLVIVCLHIPLHSGTMNREKLYDLLNGRKAHVMSGHTHYNENVIQNDIYEHNHGTVCGAWWTGPICGDGTPCGYGVYNVKGNELSWHYQSTGMDATHQMTVTPGEMNAGKKQVLVNIWNYDAAWKTEYAVDGKPMGALEQFEGFDPLAYKTMLGPALPTIRGFAEPKKTNHLFRALVPANARNIRVTATDRFGKSFITNTEL